MADPTETGTAGAERGLAGVVARLDALTGQDEVSVADIAEAFGTSSFVAVMLVPALLVISPLSGVPFLSSVCGLSIALVAAQMLARRRHLWLPGRLRRARLDGARVHRAVSGVRRVAVWIDGRARDRLGALTRPPLATVPQALCLVAGLAMPFLELVPFSSSLLATAVVFFGAGFLTRDGLYTVIGAVVMGVAAMVPLGLVSALVGA